MFIYIYIYHERILSISGGKTGCAKCLGMVVAKLAEVRTYLIHICMHIRISKHTHVYI
jgi:hypothetical protein